MNWRWLCKIIGHRWKPRTLKEIKAEPWGWQTNIPIVKCERCGATEP